MNDSLEYTGFEHGRPDVNSPGGILKVHLIAVARSLQEAETAVGDVMGSTSTLRLISRGPVELAQARTLGIPEGAASVL